MAQITLVRDLFLCYGCDGCFSCNGCRKNCSSLSMGGTKYRIFAYEIEALANCVKSKLDAISYQLKPINN